MTAVAITPTLFFGPASSAGELKNLVVAADAAEAYHQIREGFLALLPPGSWDEATEVLRRLGCTEIEINTLFMRAKRGIRNA